MILVQLSHIKEKIKPYFSTTMQSIILLVLFLPFSVLVSFLIIFSNYEDYFLYIISAIAIINLVILLRKQNKWVYIFFLYSLISLILGGSILYITKFYSSGIFAIAMTSALMYLTISTLLLFLAMTTKIIIKVVGREVLVIVVISALVAYYLPTYTASLVNNIYGLEETLLISSTISLLGLPIFDKLRRNTTNRLSSQLFMVFIALLISLLIMTLYISYTGGQIKTTPITVNTDVLSFVTTKAIKVPLNISALINALSISLFILGVFGIFLVLKKLNFILKDISKGKKLKDLEITEEHFKELENNINKLQTNMKEKLQYIDFDPVVAPLPTSKDLRALLSMNNPWWEKTSLEINLLRGVSNDVLIDASYHLNKHLDKEARAFIDELYVFIPERLDAYCNLYDALVSKYDLLLLRILYSKIIKSEYYVNYNLDIIKQMNGLEDKYREALKSLNDVKEISKFERTERRLDIFKKKIKEIESLTS